MSSQAPSTVKAAAPPVGRPAAQIALGGAGERSGVAVATQVTGRVCDPIILEIVRRALLRDAERDESADRAHRDVAIYSLKEGFLRRPVFDGDGRLVVGSNLPIFGDVIGMILEHYPLARPGARLPGVYDDEIVAFAQSWAHFNDTGGMRAGSLSLPIEDFPTLWVPTIRAFHASPAVAARV